MKRVLAIAALLLCFCAALAQSAIETLTEGGAIGPGGVEAICDLPVELRLKNTGGMGRGGPGTGAGLCVFTSIEHAGRWQNVPELHGFQKWMTTREGGGYPEKVDRLMKQFAPGVRYVQHTGGDVDFLYEAIQTGRMPSVTYAGRDMHYGPRQRIAHMVNLIHVDPPEKTPRLCAVLDNNYPGENQIVWMTAEEFRSRWLDMYGGWAVVLLAPAPPPPPRT